MTELDEARERLERIASSTSVGYVVAVMDAYGSEPIGQLYSDLRTLLTAWNTRPSPEGEPVAWRWRWEGQSKWCYADHLPRPDADEADALFTRPRVPAGLDREAVARIIREHVKVDATGLAPAVVGHCIFGFEEAADAILSLIGGGGVPAGLRLVPVEPTGAQATAIAEAVREMAVPTSIDPDEVYFDGGQARLLYAALLSASTVEG
jgi:hypothetical protein